MTDMSKLYAPIITYLLDFFMGLMRENGIKVDTGFMLHYIINTPHNNVRRTRDFRLYIKFLDRVGDITAIRKTADAVDMDVFQLMNMLENAYRGRHPESVFASSIIPLRSCLDTVQTMRAIHEAGFWHEFARKLNDE